MPLTFRLGSGHFHAPAVVFTYGLGIAGGFAALAAHLPLPMLLGSLLAVGGAALAGLRPFGRPPEAPQQLRMVFVPIIGVSIGGSFRPEILAAAPLWWPSLLALCLYIPLVHVLAFRAVLATGATDRVTAWFGSAPGGLIETVQMGEEQGGDVRMLTMLQFLRLILTIMLVPLAFSLMEGHAVGSAGGAVMPGTGLPLGWSDLVILGLSAVFGAVAGVRLRMPAGHIFGPILLSGAAHLAGLTQASPPSWLVGVTQVVIGTSLGVRFVGMEGRAFLTALRLAAVNVALTIGVALAITLPVAGLVGEPVAAVFLAFAPGGLVEMGLIALSLNMSVVYVTAHHVLRIVLAVLLARGLAPRMLR